jgi:glycosyltransferase involved in cell wall biosynthesis
MRIGLDARFLTHSQAGGFKTYTTNLVAALADLDSENDYIVYVDRTPVDRDRLPRTANMRVCAVPGGWPLVGMPVREQYSLRRRIAADRLDLVHFLCNTATIGIRTPHVVTLHDRLQLAPQPFPMTPGAGSVHRWVVTAYSRQAIRPALTSAARVITVSRYEGDALAREHALVAERIVVTHEAPDPVFRYLTGPDRERARHEVDARLGVRPPFLIGVGYEPRKQIPTLIRAFGVLAAAHPDLRLVIVAAALDSHAAFQSLAHTTGAGDRVSILGGVGLQDMASLYNLAEALVFPSIREGFGLPPLEAMACGAPVIARRATSVPEIVSDAALLLDSGDPDEWAAAIDQVRSRPELRDELVRRGLCRAASFSWRRCAEETLAVYRSVGQECCRKEAGPR